MFFLKIAAKTSNNESKIAISDRTDLRKGVSEAKFDGQADFHVQKIPAPPKSAENHEKPKNFAKIFRKKIFRRFFFSIRNRLKRVLAKFRRSKSCEKVANNPKSRP